MFKKVLQIATAFGVLLAGYAVYGHVFALVARGLSLSGPTIPMRLQPVMSVNHLKAIALAQQAFGNDHWTTRKDLPIRLYNAERGFWMYAQDYHRHKDGKHVDFTPFAIIMTSGDGRVLKTAVSDIAKIVLDQPFNLAPKPGTSSSMRVVNARIEGNVHLRDDKGTPRNVADDLRIGPLDWIEYDEAKLQITSDSPVIMEDDVYRITGTGLLIKLRPKDDDGLPHPAGTPTGFEDAQTAYLFKNVHIVINDVGSGGILPGTSRAGAGASVSAKGAQATGPAKPREPTPLDLRCDGLMQVDFPRRRSGLSETFVGPPDPPGPTVAQFSRNVEVVRGKALPDRDQLNCDHLRLTLVPPDRPRAARAAVPAEAAPLSLDLQVADSVSVPAGDPTAPSPTAKGPMSDLALKEAVASGHNVRLVSAAQDIKVRCNELIYKKQNPGRPDVPSEQPDTTYFRGDRTTGLIVEKLDRASDGPTKGQITTFTTIRAIDATIFDDHRGNDYAVIVASGPGEMEARPGPGLNGPIERTAHWNDRLTIRPINPVAARPGTPAVPIRKRVTLTGKPGFCDIPARATLDGRDKQSTIDIFLKPKAPNPTAATQQQPGGGSYEIEHLVASKDVLLVTPGKTLTARNDLQAAFIPFDAPPIAPGAKPTTPAPAPAKPAATATATPAAKPAAEPAKPAEPEAKASADRVWARVFLKPAGPAGESMPSTPGLIGGGSAGGARKSEIDEVRLRGTVVIHQEPSPGKARGTEIAGEAVDLFNQGGKGSKFIVYSDDPKPEPDPKARATSKARTDDDAELFRPLAMVDSDEMVIRGRRIGLDQATDQAWVDGNGSLTQLAPSNLLSEKSEPIPAPVSRPTDARNRVANNNKAATEPRKSSPMTIFFAGFPNYGKGMHFVGRSTDPTGRTVARAEFYKDVHAETEDSTLDCQDLMRTYFDRPIKLIRDKPATPDPQVVEPKAEVALIQCVRKVVVVNTKRDPAGDNAIVQRQRIVGDSLTYERSTGKFKVPGEGTVYLYELEGQSNPLGPKPRAGAGAGAGAGPVLAPTSGRVIRPTAGPGRGRGERNAVVGRTEGRNPAGSTVSPRSPVRRAIKPIAPPLVLTQVHFTTEMHGRFGTGQGADRAEDRWADFFGDVETFRAKVAGPDATLDPDHPPLDATFLTAQIMRVVSEPAPPGAAEKDPNAPPRYLLRAWENAFASTEDRTIQSDTITYDSRTNLFYAYGEDGRDIIIAQQGQPGQAATVAPGQTLMYNLKTGQSQLSDPKSISLIDAKTAWRAAPVKPPSDTLKPRLPPRKPFINRTNSLERKGYTGS